MAYRFYNGYNNFVERLHYSKPGDPRQQNLDGIWLLDAKGQSFFEAPALIELDNGGASITKFDIDIAKRFSHFGVVLVDPDREETRFGYPVEKTDKAARERGDTINNKYLLDVVQAYISNVEEIRAAGRTAMPAQGYTKFALKKIGMADPALQVKNFVDRAAESERVAHLEKLVEQLMAKNTVISADPR
jgi:hypothetical protein